MYIAHKDKIWLAGLLICMIINISWFMSDAILGGSARYGEIVQGAYYVANHGNMTEVSEASWRWNLRFNTMARVSIPLTFVMFWLAADGIGSVVEFAGKKLDESDFWNQTTGSG